MMYFAVLACLLVVAVSGQPAPAPDGYFGIYGGKCTLKDFGPDGTGKLRPVPGKCDKYYQCTPVTSNTYYWLERSCGYALYFQEKSQRCERPEDVQCYYEKPEY